MSEVVQAAPRKDRIASLDVARGFALLGIFLVNIDFFALPFGEVGDPGRPAPDAQPARALFWLVRALCEQRFYPLFSLLFGMGLVLQRESVLSRGAPFVPLYLRRTLWLILIGAVHGLFFWYGDILLTYGLVALLLLAVSGLSGRSLAWATAASFALSLLVLVPLQALQALQRTGTLESAPVEEGVQPSAEQGAAEQGGPFDQLVDGLLAGEVELLGERWSELETDAYQNGGYFQAFGFRSISFLLVLMSSSMGGFLTILTMFLLGATLVKLDFLTEREVWLRRALPFLILLGVPFSVVAALVFYAAPPLWGIPLGQFLTIVAGITMALLYFGFWQWCCHISTPLVRWVTQPMAAAGRMALTNYLGQTLIATFVMYHWGLGLFGQTSYLWRIGLVVVVWLLQVAASVLWLRFFRFGPFEWLWRCATYLEPQPMRRR